MACVSRLRAGSAVNEGKGTSGTPRIGFAAREAQD
jgi:hypothetical protein